MATMMTAASRLLRCCAWQQQRAISGFSKPNYTTNKLRAQPSKVAGGSAGGSAAAAAARQRKRQQQSRRGEALVEFQPGELLFKQIRALAELPLHQQHPNVVLDLVGQARSASYKLISLDLAEAFTMIDHFASFELPPAPDPPASRRVDDGEPDAAAHSNKNDFSDQSNDSNKNDFSDSERQQSIDSSDQADSVRHQSIDSSNQADSVRHQLTDSSDQADSVRQQLNVAALAELCQLMEQSIGSFAPRELCIVLHHLAALKQRLADDDAFSVPPSLWPKCQSQLLLKRTLITPALLCSLVHSVGRLRIVTSLPFYSMLSAQLLKATAKLAPQQLVDAVVGLSLIGYPLSRDLRLALDQRHAHVLDYLQASGDAGQQAEYRAALDSLARLATSDQQSN